MWPLRRIFVCFSLALFLIGSVCLVRFRRSASKPRLVPEFLPDAPRFRSNRVCASNALVLVNSSPRNAHRRQIIRETWGHPLVTGSLELRVVFGVGSTGDAQTQRPVDWESETFGDIFQIPLVDSYHTLQRKILHLLKVAATACESPPLFFVKVDDDVFVNVFALQQLIEKLRSRALEKTIWCLVWKGMPVIRSNHSKWTVTHEEFNKTVYPTYCSGSAYLLNSEVLGSILRQHYDMRRGHSSFPLEDVYITGVLAKESGVGHEQLGNVYAFESINDENVALGRTIFAHLGPNMVDHTVRLWHALVTVRRSTKTESAAGL